MPGCMDWTMGGVCASPSHLLLLLQESTLFLHHGWPVLAQSSRTTDKKSMCSSCLQTVFLEDLPRTPQCLRVKATFWPILNPPKGLLLEKGDMSHSWQCFGLH